MTDLSDDQILELAEAIRQRRQITMELETFRSGQHLMIRWATGLGPRGRAYVDVAVTPDEVAAIIEAKTAPQIKALGETIATLRKGRA